MGRKPFNIKDCENLKYARLALAGAPGLKDPRWLDLSPDAKDLLMGMLTFDPARRLTAAQVLRHEWVGTRGGLVERRLGADVALGAAGVAEMRRLRFLCSGAVALQRAGAAASDAKSARTPKRVPSFAKEGSTREHVAYLGELRRVQKREASVHGGRSMRGVARALNARTFQAAHDAGGSVHRRVFDADASTRGVAWEPAATHAHAAPGMRRVATALFLGEVLAATQPDPSVSGGMKRSHTLGELGAPSGLSLLGASVRQYLEVSVHGGRTGSRRGSESVDISTSIEDSAEGELLKVVQVRRGSLDGKPTAAGGAPRRTSTEARRPVRALQPLV